MGLALLLIAAGLLVILRLLGSLGLGSLTVSDD